LAELARQRSRRAQKGTALRFENTGVSCTTPFPKDIIGLSSVRT